MLFSSWIQSKNMEAARELQVRSAWWDRSHFRVGSWSRSRGDARPMTAVPSDLEGSGVNAIPVIPHDLAERFARGDSAKVELLYKDAENKSRGRRAARETVPGLARPHAD
jgi:hypothetical protein